MSILLQTTYSHLSQCAQATNLHTQLGKDFKYKPARKPFFIERSSQSLLRTHRRLRNTHLLSPKYAQIKLEHQRRKRHHARLLRHSRTKETYIRDKQFNAICSSSPSVAFKLLRNIRHEKASKINRLVVDDKIFTGDNVPDGMFRSIEQLKTEPVTLPHENSDFPDYAVEYNHILDICEAGARIPPITEEKSLQILNHLRKNVNDYFSITPSHFLNAGDAGIVHFHFLLNALISNINLAGLAELNTIYACVLYKGNNKNKEQCRSYRTISTCPLLAKAIDLYIRELAAERWNAQQASTQFQGSGMNHELASLLLTETIQYSLNVSDRPVFALFLDAKSAFDRVVKEILIRNLFNSGMEDQSLLYLDRRLGNRRTFCDFDRNLMGPILDTRGLEQGGITSSDEYKLYNNEQADVAQSSNLGVTIGNDTVSCISLADDALLVANAPVDLRNLLFLTARYCAKYDVELVPEKMQLIAFHYSHHESEVNLVKQTFELEYAGHDISFTDQALHLGVSRSEKQPENMTSILDRLAAHRRQLFSLLPAGMALRHSGNPAANLRAHTLFCMPVLLSGLASLFLRQSEISTINKYHRGVLIKLMKLLRQTPDCATYFLAGSLPAEGYLHLRQLCLFGMICRLEDNILKNLAFRALICPKPAEKSWFHQIERICKQYGLPNALDLLGNPPPKQDFQKLCKLKVNEFWHMKLSLVTQTLSSLKYLNTNYLSLTSPHPIWTSLDGNPFQARAATVQAHFLSGRYRTERLCRFWSTNPDGYCLQESCKGLSISEDIEHILVRCPALTDKRRRLLRLSSDCVSQMPLLSPIINEYLLSNSDEMVVQFLVDCSTLPMVIAAYQLFGPSVHASLFKLTRTWCFSLHRARLQLLGRHSAI